MQAKGLKPNHIEPKLILVATWAYLDDHRADLVHHGYASLPRRPTGKPRELRSVAEPLPAHDLSCVSSCQWLKYPGIQRADGPAERLSVTDGGRVTASVIASARALPIQL